MTTQPPYLESKELERTRKQIEYEAILDQVKTHTALFLHGCVVNMSLQKIKHNINLSSTSLKHNTVNYIFSPSTHVEFWFWPFNFKNLSFLS